MSTVKGAPDRLVTYQAELSQALASASADSGAVASESARSSVRTQLQAGVPASAILDDAAARFDVETVRATRQEVGPFLLATAGNNQAARTEAIKGRQQVEHAADRVLARIGIEAEQEVAKLRLGSTVLIESAGQLAEKAGQFAAKGELDPQARMSMAYAKNEAEAEQAAVEGSAA